MLDHAITVRDVLYVSGLSVGVIVVAFGIYVAIAWLRMKRDYRDALRATFDDGDN